MKIASRTIQNRYCFFDRLQLRFFIDFASILETIWEALGAILGEKSSNESRAQGILNRRGQNLCSGKPRRPHPGVFWSFPGLFSNEIFMFGVIVVLCCDALCCVVLLNLKPLNASTLNPPTRTPSTLSWLPSMGWWVRPGVINFTKKYDHHTHQD